MLLHRCHMMTLQSFFRLRPGAIALSAVLLLGLSASTFAQRATAPPTEAPASPALEQMSADELVRAATAGFDRWETADPGEAKDELLRETLRIVSRLQSVDPMQPLLPMLRARSYIAGERRGDAITELRKFVESREGKNDWRAFRMLGDLFVDEFPRQAKSSYSQARTLNPSEPSVLYGLSLAELKLGDTDEAVRLGADAVSADGRKTAKYVTHLARVYASARRWSEAEHEAQTALSLAETAARSEPGSRAAVEELEGQYRLIIDLLQSRLAQMGGAPPAAEEFLRLADYVRGRTAAAERLSRFEELRIIETGIRRAGASVPLKLAERHAVLLAEIGRTDQAITAFDNLLKIDPQNTAASEWLARLRGGEKTGG